MRSQAQVAEALPTSRSGGEQSGGGTHCASPLDPSCGARNIPALTCKPKPASGKHAEQPPDNNKLHNRKMPPRRQAGAAAQPTTMPFCNNGQSSSGPSTPPTASWTMSRMRRRRL